jgi:hypothetical protein
MQILARACKCDSESNGPVKISSERLSVARVHCCWSLIPQSTGAKAGTKRMRKSEISRGHKSSHAVLTVKFVQPPDNPAAFAMARTGLLVRAGSIGFPCGFQTRPQTPVVWNACEAAECKQLSRGSPGPMFLHPAQVQTDWLCAAPPHGQWLCPLPLPLKSSFIFSPPMMC